MNRTEIEAIISEISYKDWIFCIGEKNEVLYLQIQWNEKKHKSGKESRLYCRKWQLSEHMAKSEIIQTAFKAALAAEEHECREQFKYRGESVFGPHFDVDALHEIAKAGRLDCRW
jgi:hypothetical protein